MIKKDNNHYDQIQTYENHDSNEEEEMIDESMYRYRMKNLDTGEISDLREYQPPPPLLPLSLPLPAPPPPPLAREAQGGGGGGGSTTTRIAESFRSFGWRLFQGIETIGESVVSFLGLEDSYFQEILDQMTSEEREAAERIHRQRQEEYQQFFQNHPNHPNHPDRVAKRLEAEEQEEQATALAVLSTVTGGAIDLGTRGGEEEAGGSERKEGRDHENHEEDDNDDVELQLTSSTITTAVITSTQPVQVNNAESYLPKSMENNNSYQDLEQGERRTPYHTTDHLSAITDLLPNIQHEM